MSAFSQLKPSLKQRLLTVHAQTHASDEEEENDSEDGDLFADDTSAE